MAFVTVFHRVTTLSSTDLLDKLHELMTSIRSYSQDELLNLQPSVKDTLMIGDLLKPLQEAGVAALIRHPKATHPDDIPTAKPTKSSDTLYDTQYSKAKTLFQNSRTRSSSGDSSRPNASNGSSQSLRPNPALAAQKEDGFQKFYKAVVSPTHVRVTAGGRIVPNTKLPGSPTAKGQPRDINESLVQNMQQTMPHLGLYPAAGQAGVPSHSHFGFPHGMMPPMPFPGAYGMNVPTSVPGIPPVFDPAQLGISPRSLAADSALTEQLLAQSRYINPWAAQFPFGMPNMFSGGYLPSPFMNPVIPSTPVMHSQGPPPGLLPNSSNTQQSTQAPSRQQSGSGSASHQNENISIITPAASSVLKAPLNPPVSSIRPSQISRAHLESLRTNLRRVEDQLQYNVHQIDVPTMEQRAKEIREAIKGLEETLPIQLEFEEAHYPKLDKSKSAKSTSSTAPAPASVNSTTGPVSRKEVRRMRSVNHQIAVASGKYSRDSRDYKGKNVSTRTGSSESEYSRVAGIMTPTAPPFRPSGWEDKVDEGDSIEHSRKSHAGGSRPSSAASRIMPQFGASSDAHIIKKSAKPYLEGELLPGMDEISAVKNGFHYSRPLTDDELRARHLYWGRAPQSALRGLPKFDGKDFYFASPPKVRHSVRNSMGNSRPWTRRVSRDDDAPAKKPTVDSQLQPTEVSVDISASHLSDNTCVPSSNGSRENSDSTQVEDVKNQPLAQKVDAEPKSPVKPMSWGSNELNSMAA